MTVKPKIFTKARVANIMSAIVIIWGMLYFTGGLDNGAQAVGEGNSEVVAGIMGFAAKHLWDAACGED